MNPSPQRVVVLGASPKPDRYSNRAVKLLQQFQHIVIPVHPAADQVEGIPVVQELSQIDGAVDTITVYISPKHSSALAAQITACDPKRVIFNPGSENPDLVAKLRARGITTEEACTLVLLNTGQF